MKILLCHNAYRHRGGEDQVFEDERKLLRAAGHEVVTYHRCNDEINESKKIKTALQTVWNKEVYRDLTRLAQQEQPDVVHFHNTFAIISPAAYYAARDLHLPIVQTLHNFRLLCPNSALLRDGKVCEQCVGKPFALASVRHACYKSSRAASLVKATMLAVHWRLGTWTSVVTRYIALTSFARQKFIAGGFPAEKICVKPNCVQPDPGMGTNDGGFAVYVGRLSPEKGVAELLQAWRILGERIPLKIAGEGPLEHLVKEAQAEGCRVEWLGMLPHQQVLDLIGRARILLCPSVCHEGFGRSVIEAFAAGAAVVASDIAPMDELIDAGKTGLLVQRGNVEDMIAAVDRLVQDEPLWSTIRGAAREQYELHYTPHVNCRQLVEIYEEAIEAFPQNLSTVNQHGSPATTS